MRLTTMALALALLAAVIGPALVAAEVSTSQDRTWAHFKQAVKFDKQLLPEGNYLLLHDDEKKAAGEPCLYVFGESNLDEPLLAVHCVRIARKPIDENKVVLDRPFRSGEVRQFDYVQFAGDAYSHNLR